MITVIKYFYQFTCNSKYIAMINEKGRPVFKLKVILRD